MTLGIDVDVILGCGYAAALLVSVFAGDRILQRVERRHSGEDTKDWLFLQRSRFHRGILLMLLLVALLVVMISLVLHPERHNIFVGAVVILPSLTMILSLTRKLIARESAPDARSYAARRS